MTFTVDGTEVSGAGEYLVSCGNYGGGGSLTVDGTIAADGSFSAQTGQTLVGASLLVQGHVPRTAGLPWTGSYAIDTSNAGSCKVQEQKAVTPQPIANFSGQYVGSGVYTQGTTLMPVALQLTMRQGTTLQDALGNSELDTTWVTGELVVTGVPCFSKGSTTLPTGTPAAPSRNVWGDSMHPVFRMDDGSQLGVNASVADASGITLQTGAAVVLGGNCQTSATSTLRINSLARAN